MDKKRIQQIQSEMARLGIDGWLLYDFHGYNDIAIRFLNLRGIITRRSFYLIPASGQPVAFVHVIEKKPFDSLPGSKIYYSSYRVLEEELGRALSGMKRIAMEYSPHGRLPYIGKVDGGTLELIRSFDIEIVTSADLVSRFDACLDDQQIDLHKQAAGMLNDIVINAFNFIRDRLEANQKVNEFDVVQFILKEFNQNSLITDQSPICTTGANGGNPHYEPPEVGSANIERDRLVLIDVWAKLRKPDSVYADITWMAYTGSSLPDDYANNFQLLCMARDAAVSFIKETWNKGSVYGYQVDDVCRNVISHVDLGNHFTHRTGHSITEMSHGPGPNIDNLETEDRRKLMPGHLFSIEPGLYFEDYGMRTEIDVLITEKGPEVTTQPVQNEIILLFA